MGDFVQTVTMSLGTTDLKPSALPTIENINLVNAEQWYSYVIPNGTRKFVFWIKSAQGGDELEYNYSADHSKVMTLEAGTGKGEDNVLLNNTTIYFKCNVAGRVLQIESWR